MVKIGFFGAFCPNLGTLDAKFEIFLSGFLKSFGEFPAPWTGHFRFGEIVYMGLARDFFW